MALNATKQSWLVTISIASTAAAFVWFVFLPGKQRIDELHQQIDEKQRFATTLGEILEQTTQFQQQLENTNEYVRHWESAAPSASDLSRIYARIAEVAKEAGVITTRFSPEPAIKLAKLQKLPVRLGCLGTFQSMRRLLSGIEQLPEGVWVNDIVLEVEGEEREKLNCELSLVVFAKIFGNSD